ncbi:MAG: hypothetical protein SFT81_05635 [Candidatus Caenarcaniphilales bacterium]|nr:hypothetical protein [Candidatus Caenarcaniphilales bacterium]
MAIRSGHKGTIVTWLLLMALFGLFFILMLISVEFLNRWITLERVKKAAEQSSLVFAREIVKLRDNESVDPTKSFTTLQNADPFIRDCAQDADETGGGTNTTNNCTQLDDQLVASEGYIGAISAERTVAIQTLLYNLYYQVGLDSTSNPKAPTPYEIKNLNQNQCYTAPGNTRFNLIGLPPSCSGGSNNLISPLTDLQWRIVGYPYGQGVCTLAPGDSLNSQKDFCVETIVRGRLDPTVAGGIPFLKENPYISQGNFQVVGRAVVMKGEFNPDANTDYDRSLDSSGLPISQSYAGNISSSKVLNVGSDVAFIEKHTSDGRLPSGDLSGGDNWGP